MTAPRNPSTVMLLTYRSPTMSVPNVRKSWTCRNPASPTLT